MAKHIMVYKMERSAVRCRVSITFPPGCIDRDASKFCSELLPKNISRELYLRVQQHVISEHDRINKTSEDVPGWSDMYPIYCTSSYCCATVPSDLFSVFRFLGRGGLLANSLFWNPIVTGKDLDLMIAYQLDKHVILKEMMLGNIEILH